MKVKTSIFLLFILLITSVFVPAQKIKEKDLSEKYQKWLRLTKYIIHGKELDVLCS